MNSNTKNSIGAVCLVIIIGFGAFYIGKHSSKKSTTQPPSTAATTTEVSEVSPKTEDTSVKKPTAKPPVTATQPSKVNTAGFHSFSSSDYGFVIKYPPYVQARNTFTTFHQIGNNWRLNADQANQGKGLLELSIFSIDQGSVSDGKQKYPLFFSSLVRVGVSPNVKECYTQDEGYTNQKITNVTINGIAFKRFSVSDAGMMKYVQSESYRTIHNNMCYVLEQIKNGSSYRDEKMAPGIADTTLTSYYDTGATIIKTFTFTK